MINIYSSQSNQNIDNNNNTINNNNNQNDGNSSINIESNSDNIGDNTLNDNDNCDENINNNNNNSNNNNNTNTIYSGNENYMIISRVLSNTDFIGSNNMSLTASGNYIPIINNSSSSISNSNINLNSSLPPTPPIPPQYSYNNLTPTNSDSESDYSDCLLQSDNINSNNIKNNINGIDKFNNRSGLNDSNDSLKSEEEEEKEEEDGEEECNNKNINNNSKNYKNKKYLNVNNNQKSKPIKINNNGNRSKLKSNNNNNQLGIDDFEIIEIEEDQDQDQYINSGSNNSISPPQASPFKQLLTSKLKSIKDKIESSPSSEKYNTFPLDRFDRFNNIVPTSDIILYSSPLHGTSNSNILSDHNLLIKGSGGLIHHNNHNNGYISTFSPIVDNIELNNDSNYNNNNNNQNELLPSTPLNINNISPSSSITKEIFDYDQENNNSNYIIQQSTNNNIILDNNNNNNNDYKSSMIYNSNLIRGYSNSSITRPVLSYEKTKVNYKILILLSLSVFFSVSNLYYAQPLLNEIGKIRGDSVEPLPYGITSLVTMSVQIGYALGLLFISILGEVMSKKKLTLVLSMINCGALALIGLSTHIAMVIVFHFIVGVSTIIPYIAVPLALDMAPDPQDRGSIVSVLLSSVFVGLLGARVTSGVIGFLFGWRVVFYFAAITMFIISLLLFYFLPYIPRNQNIIPYNKLLLSTFSFLKEKTLRQTCFIGSMVFATFSILWTTLSYRLNDEPYEYNSGFIGLFGLIGMAGAIASPVSGRIAERFGINRLMVIYIFICAIGYFILMFFDSHIVGLIFGIFVLDLGVQSCHISNQSRNNHLLVEEQSKYSINTIYMASYLIGGSIGSGISGVVYSHWNWSGSSVVALIFLGLALVCHLVYGSIDKSLINGNHLPINDFDYNNNYNNNNNNNNNNIDDDRHQSIIQT